MNSAPKRSALGLIAGQGVLPLLVARGMRDAGAEVHCVGLRGQFDAELPRLCTTFAPAGIARIGSWIRILRRAGVCEAVMVGRVAKARMHSPFAVVRHLPDWRAVSIWYRRLRHDRRNAVLLAAVADALADGGITLIDSTAYIPDHLAQEGVHGRVAPTAAQDADVRFGWPLLEQALRLEIGQAMAVRERDVIAVEAVEGTDRMIVRAGELCRARGWTLLKSATDDHDRRADVPSIGVDTVRRMAGCGGGCLTLGAGRVILLDRSRVIEEADRAGIAIVGVAAGAPTP